MQSAATQKASSFSLSPKNSVSIPWIHQEALKWFSRGEVESRLWCSRASPRCCRVPVVGRRRTRRLSPLLSAQLPVAIVLLNLSTLTPGPTDSRFQPLLIRDTFTLLYYYCIYMYIVLSNLIFNGLMSWFFFYSNVNVDIVVDVVNKISQLLSFISL